MNARAQGPDRVFHGINVPEPCRWLENADDPAVKEWAAEQHRRAGVFLEGCSQLTRCREFLAANVPPLDPPWRSVRPGASFRMSRRAPGSQPALCVTDESGAERVLVDPETLGKTLNPDYLSVSPSGRYVAYVLSAPGVIPATMHICETATGTEIDRSTCTTAVPMFAWLPDEAGFFYSLFRRLFGDDGSADLRSDGLYLHSMGSEWRSDRCIRLSPADAVQMSFAIVPDLADCLLIGIHHFSSHRDGFTLHRLTEPDSPGIELIEEGLTYAEYLGSAHGQLYFHTCLDAPMGRIVAIDPARAQRPHWRTIVAGSEHALARPERFPGPVRAAVSDAGVFVTLVEHAHHVMEFHPADGSSAERIAVPLPCTVDCVEREGKGFRILAQSFLIPRIEYFYAGPGRGLEAVSRVDPARFDATPYELRQVFYPARDGTRVPMYLLHRKDLPLHGNHPMLLYGYGGFGQAITPEYTPEAALWLDLGGVYALANIRGGGEYGETWHAAGRGLHKQTGFDDFYAAAEYLIEQGYTGAGKLAARGISNGGLLTAVTANQRPDLFAAVVSEIPLTDLLWLDETAAGQSIGAEYGNPFESREMFEVLRSYSPAHNVHGDGPAQLVVVAEQDFSAPPGQAFKFVAARQAALAEKGRNTPMLLRLVAGEGHGGWRLESTQGVLAEEIAFAWEVLHGPARAPDLRNALAPMRDGVQLAANVWLPARKECSSAVLLRTPYGNDVDEFARYGLQDYLNAGFAVVLQSVRGRGNSQGQFGFFFVEGEDGYDSIEWLAGQPWCDGRVAMDGGSYLGTAQWLAAREHPPHLVCILPAVPAGDWFNEIPFTGGALQVDWAFSWLGSMAGLDFDFQSAGDRNLERFRPLIDAEGVLGAELPLYRDILNHPPPDAFWHPLMFTADDFSGIGIPVMTVTGWFDGDQPGSLHYWQGIEHSSRHRDNTHLVIGPWIHAECYLGGSPRFGEMEFGGGSTLPTRQLRVQFLRRHLLGEALAKPPRVRLFIMGVNRWYEFDQYPPAEVQQRPWFLSSQGDASSARGAGRLTVDGAYGDPDRFDYDPREPVPYRPAAQDHREIEERSDVLVYTSDELMEMVVIVGQVEVILHAASDGLDTDFTAKLLDVYPDGRAVSLTHVGGILRARYRNGFDRMELLTPGESVELRIRLSHVGHAFLAGHRLRLEISSSCFPLADPNTNTGGNFATDTNCRLARQTIFHDAQHPSRLLLPVLGISDPKGKV